MAIITEEAAEAEEQVLWALTLLDQLLVAVVLVDLIHTLVHQ
jgi:hypothetical protein